MRTTLREESTTTPDAIRSVAETPPETTVAAKSDTPRQLRKRPSVIRVLRAIVVVFSALGIFAGLVLGFTGGSLSDWIQAADFKSAYTSSNMAFIQGSAALKLGNLSSAVEYVRKLDVSSSDLKDLRQQIIQAGIERKNFAASADAIAIPYPNQQAKRFDCNLFAQKLVATLGWTGARKFAAETPSGVKLGADLEDAILNFSVKTNFDEVRAIAGKLPAERREAIADSMVMAFLGRNIVTSETFEWAKSVPGAGFQNSESLRTLNESPTYDLRTSRIYSVIEAGIKKRHPEVTEWIAEMPRSGLKNSLLEGRLGLEIGKRYLDADVYSMIDQLTVDRQKQTLDALVREKWLSAEQQGQLQARIRKLPPPIVQRREQKPNRPTVPQREFYYEGPR